MEMGIMDSIHYWNMLPIDVKEASSINDFKVKLEYYKQDSICKGITYKWILGFVARNFSAIFVVFIHVL